MKNRIVILGGGTGGTLAANRLRRMFTEETTKISVVDQDNDHIYQPGLLFVPFGLADPDDLIRPRDHQLHKGIEYHGCGIDQVDVAGNHVRLNDGTVLPYDVLIVATGAVLMPGETEGLTGPGWNRNVFTFYNLEGAKALAERLATFEHGRIAVNVVDMPIKCPVAPLEFCFLADWYFHKNKRRDHIDISYVTPLDGAFTKPTASQMLSGLLAEKDINVVTQFNTGEVDADGGRLISYDEREVPFDIAVVVPLHGGAPYVGRSEGLGDALNFVPTDPHTLQSTVKDNIFVIGDASAIPTSKAGSVTHFEGEVLCDNVARYLNGEMLDAEFDGHANCFIETGYEKALLIDFNYDTEPLPGHFPMRLGLPLLKESHLNHLGKLMFQWVYWHALLPGHDIPGVGSQMPEHGKTHQHAGTGAG